MPNFKYKARDKFGKSISGIISGASKEAIAAHLTRAGYVPISIADTGQASIESWDISGLFERVTSRDLNVFTRQLYTLQKAGIPLLSSLDTIDKQTKNKRLKDITKAIMVDIEQGLSLSAALAKHPAIFSEFYVSMIRAGEASGQMDEILSRLMDFGEKEADNTAKIKAAIRYPTIVLVALAIAFTIITTFVIPLFSHIYAQLKTPLPIPTKILLGVSFVMRNYWYIILITTAALLFALFRYINTKPGRFVWDSFKLKLPIAGPIITMLVMSRFTRTMSILMKSGLPILQVLDMSSRTASNAVIARAVDSMIASVKDGKGLSEPMKLSSVFPPIVVNMVAIGETSGKVDELLMSIADYYDQQADYMIKNLTAMLEPLFVTVLGAMVLTMALAIFLPIWNLIRIFKR